MSFKTKPSEKCKSEIIYLNIYLYLSETILMHELMFVEGGVVANTVFLSRKKHTIFWQLPW